jgi:hypothetical protein
LYVYDANETRFSGKTFSAEAMSEHVWHLLYAIGGGDLSTCAADLDTSLERVFHIATAWRVIVLINEVHFSFSLSISFSGLIRYARLTFSSSAAPCLVSTPISPSVINGC